MNIFKRLFSDYNTKTLKVFEELVKTINDFEATISALTDEALSQKTLEFKNRLKNNETIEALLPEAYAVVRETAKRVLGQRHFDMQLLGGIVLHRGNIAEMKTGEGKTLVATLPTYLNALTEKGVHVVTVNDYLSRRDAVWMGQIYAFLGLTVGVVNHDSAYLYDAKHSEHDKERDQEGSYKIFYEYLRPVSRKEAYLADITYGTNNEFGFDYLRDNLVYSINDIVQRPAHLGGHYFAIVDEVDSILIDESRTPLIISSPVAQSDELYQTFKQLATKLVIEEDYTVDEKLKAVSLTEAGINKAEKFLNVDNIYTEKGIKYVHHLETAVRAKALFERDRHYVVKNDEIIIVDEFTGRLQPGRRWSEGLHQAIEAKEGVKIQAESRTYATVTYQNYFRLYKKLAGMTGTGLTSKEEFAKVYGLDTLAIPTNKTPQRIDASDLVFQTEKGKFEAIAKRVKNLQAKGQPVLIGTVSIEKNELLSAYLKQAGVRHEILNAKNHEQEGQIIADAGRKGSVVVATNMAGRGVDIKLGGHNSSPEALTEVRNMGGLFVLGTERHEARRIDNQLRGRSGRQGDPGETQFFVSLEDPLMRIFAPERIKTMMGRFGIPEDEPIENRLIARAIESAQSKIEGLHFDTRKHLLEYDDVVNHQRLSVYNRRRIILSGEIKDLQQIIDEAFERLGLEDGFKTEFWQAVNERVRGSGENVYWQNVRRAILQIVDMLWVEHLDAIEYMRNSVRLRAYGQRDPLVEFKKEGLRLFKDLELSLFDQIIKVIPNISAEIKTEKVSLTEVHQSSPAGNAKSGSPSLLQEEKVGRNDPCPCGSGKKYKKCHGK